MTVKVTPKMRKRIDAMKRKKELVTDQSHKDIHRKILFMRVPMAVRQFIELKLI